MLKQDLEMVENAIEASIYRIRDSFQRIHGCQQSWNPDIEKRFAESIMPLSEARKTLRNLFNGQK